MPSDDSLYNVYKLNDEDARYEYINRVNEKNVLDTDVSVGVSDRIVMLSTCASDYENARVVIFCKIQDK